jgi:hypothetical protein
MSHLKLRIRFVLSEKIAWQKTWFLPCPRRLRRRAGLVRPAASTLSDLHF